MTCTITWLEATNAATSSKAQLHIVMLIRRLNDPIDTGKKSIYRCRSEKNNARKKERKKERKKTVAHNNYSALSM